MRVLRWTMALLAVAVPAGAQVDTARTRATAYPQATQEALVLSGGGSRGLAHAGVLVGLEERGHDPDLVVGTSIGALVGALYAAGYPAEEVQAAIRAVRWGEVFTPTPLVLGPDRLVRYPLLSIDRETTPLRFNRGIIPQWRINRTLARLLFGANARSRGDFDRLARRYRAVATDLKTGEAVVLARGDLARAARASMAVPGVFAPVEWEGRSLVDGGIADNLPTDVARSFGRRRVIAVDVGQPAEEIEGRNPFAVVGRAIDLLEERSQRDSVKPDVLVVPQLDPQMAGITFPADPDPLFAIGLAAARRVIPTIPDAAKPRGLPPAPARFGALRIEAPDTAVARLARRIFRGAAPGPFDADRVLEGMDRLYTTGLFEGVWPRVEASADTAAPDLVVRLEALPRLSFSGAAGYDTDRGGRAWGSVQRARSFARAPAVLAASASADRLRQWVAGSARVYSVIVPNLVWTSGAYWQGSDIRLFERGVRTGRLGVHRAGGWIGAELPRLLSEHMLVGIVRAERIGFADASGFSVGPLVRYSTPVQEEPDVGLPFLLEAETRWGGYAYRRGAFAGSAPFAVGALELAAVGQAAAASREAPPDVLPALGDEHAMPGFRWGEERGRAMALAGADLAYPFFGGHLRGRLRVGSVADEIGALDERERWISGAEVGFHRNSIFGVLSAAYGVNSRGRRALFIDLGPRF